MIVNNHSRLGFRFRKVKVDDKTRDKAKLYWRLLGWLGQRNNIDQSVLLWTLAQRRSHRLHALLTTWFNFGNDPMHRAIDAALLTRTRRGLRPGGADGTCQKREQEQPAQH